MNYKKLDQVTFPQYRGIAVNMMPYVIGNHASIPPEYRQYIPIVKKCEIDENEMGKVGYLTITESIVDGTSQRRPGVHTERHPARNWGGGKPPGWGGGAWGGGQKCQAGLFMVSNVENSTAIFNRHIKQPGSHGDCEHLRNELGEPEIMPPNRLYWLTDATPHESLVINKKCTRQYFRLVTSGVSIWYKQHSTENRLGIKPPKSVELLSENKFVEMA